MTIRGQDFGATTSVRRGAEEPRPGGLGGAGRADTATAAGPGSGQASDHDDWLGRDLEFGSAQLEV